MAINREASDKHKGITLQKLRAVQLTFETLLVNPNAQMHVAIEREGDVFIYSDSYKFIEENKNYESKNFSFLSSQVLNTLVYFIDYWLKDTVNKSQNVFFSFYSTNVIAKENNTKHVKSLVAPLPDKPILKLLIDRDYDYANLISFCKTAILKEYFEQYNNKKGSNNYTIIQELTDEEWKNFFSQISWHFKMPANSQLKTQLYESINRFALKKKINVQGKEHFIEAMLRMRLEDNQEELDSTQRYLTSESVELIFYKVTSSPIEKNVYKYLDIDYTDFSKKLREFSSRFLQEKYHSINSNRSLPSFLDRKVKQHSSEIKIDTGNLDQSNYKETKNDVIIGDINSFVTGDKPNFLFGEIGSGKSSLVAQYAFEQNKTDKICLLIPINYVKGQITQDYKSLFYCVDSFIGSNILLGGELFKFEHLLLNVSTTIIFDGLDELNKTEVRNLTRHLEQLNQEESNVVVLASGRPLELQSVINFNHWNCLTTIDLNEDEILSILKNEALGVGLIDQEAKLDANNRLVFLKSRDELFAIAKTPLVICLLRDFLNAEIEEHSFGSLMYKVLTKRLEWDEKDMKVNYSNFLQECPTTIHRERIISVIAEKIFESTKRCISEDQLSQTITDIFADEGIDSKLIPEATSFYKNLFLQQMGDFYSFISQPLLETAYGIRLACNIRNCSFEIQLNDSNWRALSFAVAINRVKGFSEEMRPFLRNRISDLLAFEKNTAAAAIIITESKDSELARLFIEKASELDFRPLRTFGDGNVFGGSDSYSPYAIAYTIVLSGNTGLEWFILEYLDPIHPAMFNDHSVEEILANIFFVVGFKVDSNYEDKLLEIYRYHILAKTIACSSLLPVLVLIISKRIDAKERSLLLADILHHRVVGNRAKKMLENEIKDGNQKFVMGALEIVTSKNENRDSQAILLWLENHNKGEDVNASILAKAVKNASRGNDSLFEILIDKFGKENLYSFLRFNALNNTEIGSSAAILLFYKFDETDLYLIARPILVENNLDNFEDSKLRDILQEILFKFPSVAFTFIKNYMPFKKGKNEITELFVYSFNKILTEVEDIHKKEFLHIINYLPEKAFLSRYPEIRDSFKKLLQLKPQYGEFLKEAYEALDFRLAFNASSIMLCCYPDNAKKEIEKTIRSSHKRLGNHDEWLKFCMKLFFNKEVLDHIYAILPSLMEVSKYYALCILYHNNYNLSKNEKDDLVSGLCGEAYFLDINTRPHLQNNFKNISTEPEFFSRLVEILNGNLLESSKNAANILFSYHHDKLSDKQLAKCYILRNENSHQFFFQLDRKKGQLFTNKNFASEFDKVNSEILLNSSQESFLSLYKSIVFDGVDKWINIFERIDSESRHSTGTEFELLYYWLMALRKKNPDLTRKAGEAAKNLLSYPSIKDKTDFGSVVPHLALIASEFSDLDSYNLDHILENYNCQEEIACSFFARLGDLSKKYRGQHEKGYITIFSKNNTKYFRKITQLELDKFLYDGEEIPNNITFNLNSILIYGIPLDLGKEYNSNNRMKALMFVIIKFSRNTKVDFSLITSAMDKIGLPWYNSDVNWELREAVFIIREINLSTEDGKNRYAEILKNRIEKNAGLMGTNPDEDFLQLFILKVPLSMNVFKIILNEIVQKSYLFQLYLMFQIFDYVVSRIPDVEKAELSIELEKLLKSINSSLPKTESVTNKNQIMWMLSLLAFYIDNEARDYSVVGYLKGLESIFITRVDNSYLRPNGQTITINGESLLKNSDIILEKINPEIIQESLIKGIEIGTPEIKAVCRMFNKFS